MTTNASSRRWAVVERHVTPMRDGIRLAADVYRPPDKRVPSLLVRTPYGRRELHDRIEDVDPLLGVREGFAVVMQDLRGRGASEGEFCAKWPDAQDGADTVAWIRRQGWSDGRVAMLGASYNGIVQFQTARERPPGLVAIAPSMSGSFRGLSHPGGAPRLALIALWLTRLLREALSGELDDDARAEVTELLGASLLDRFHAFLQPGTAASELGLPLRHWIRAQAADRFWTDVTAVPHDPLPALHTTGWYDFAAAAAVEAYASWSAASGVETPQLLTLGPWTHELWLPACYPELGLDAEHSPAKALPLERQISFVKAVLGEAAIDELVPVTSFVLGRNRWHEDTRWPPADVRPVAWRLASDAHGHGCLTLRSDTRRAAIGYTYDPRDPVPTLGGANMMLGLAGPREQAAVEARPDVLTFTSDALAEELEVAGSPVARLVVGSSAVATDFIARLTLVHAGGGSIVLVEGNWCGRLADLPAALGNQPHRMCEIDLGPVHVAIAPGSRLRLQVTSSNYPELYPNPNTGHDLAEGPPPRVETARQAVLVGADDGSSLTLPVRRSSAVRQTAT